MYLLPKCVCLVSRLSSRFWARSLSKWWVSLIERKQHHLVWGLTVNHNHVKVLSRGNHYLLFPRDSWDLLQLFPFQLPSLSTSEWEVSYLFHNFQSIPYFSATGVFLPVYMKSQLLTRGRFKVQPGRLAWSLLLEQHDKQICKCL